MQTTELPEIAISLQRFPWRQVGVLIENVTSQQLKEHAFDAEAEAALTAELPTNLGVVLFAEMDMPDGMEAEVKMLGKLRFVRCLRVFYPFNDAWLLRYDMLFRISDTPEPSEKNS